MPSPAAPTRVVSSAPMPPTWAWTVSALQTTTAAQPARRGESGRRSGSSRCRRRGAPAARWSPAGSSSRPSALSSSLSWSALRWPEVAATRLPHRRLRVRGGSRKASTRRRLRRRASPVSRCAWQRRRKSGSACWTRGRTAGRRPDPRRQAPKPGPSAPSASKSPSATADQDRHLSNWLR